MTTHKKILAALTCLGSVLTAQDQPQDKAQKAQCPVELQVQIQALDKAIRVGDEARLDKLFDVDALLARALRGAGGTDKNKTAFSRGVKRSFRFGRTLLAQVRGSNLTRLRTMQVDGEWRAVYRRISNRGAVGYIEYVFVRQGDTWRGVDMYGYHQGELNSALLRRFYDMGSVAQADKDPEFLKSLHAMRKMSVLAKNGQPEAALREYDKIPKKMRLLKSNLLMRLRCAQKVGGEAYETALADFERVIPKTDPARALVLVDYYTQKKQWDKVLDCLAQLQQRSGGDPYLNVLTGSIWLKRADGDKAMRQFDLAIAEEPELMYAHLARVQAALKLGDHEITATALKSVLRFRPRMNAIKRLQGFEEFAQSDAGRRWLKAHATPSTPNR